MKRRSSRSVQASRKARTRVTAPTPAPAPVPARASAPTPSVASAPQGHRVARRSRASAETRIDLCLDLDGQGKSRIATGIPFFDHMLGLLARHGLIDLTLEAGGDVEVDYHHLVEDVGIVLGQTFKDALGRPEGIERFGHAITPIDEALAVVALDISGRGHLETARAFEGAWVRDFDLSLLEEFLRAFATQAGITLHVRLLSGVNPHHKAEAAFKGLARALRDATRHNPRILGVLSTKGHLDGLG